MSDESKEHKFKPIGEALPGMTIWELPPDCVPLGAFLGVKYLTPDGHEVWCSRFTEHLNKYEALGSMNVFYDLLLRETVELYNPSQDED